MSLADVTAVSDESKERHDNDGDTLVNKSRDLEGE